MPSKSRIRRRFLERISFSKSKDQEIIDHHAHLPRTTIMQAVQPTIAPVQPTIAPVSVPNSVKDIEIQGYTLGGSGPTKTECQDTFSVLNNIAHHVHFFAVYDGHGPNGRAVSSFVNQTISNSLTKHAIEVEKAIDTGSANTYFSALFKSTDSKLMHSIVDCSNSGSCCISVLISKNRCYVANVGDSRAILCRESSNGQMTVIDLSNDQKPSRQDEKARILQAGGIIEPSYFNGSPVGPLRVWNKARNTGLAMTRGFGDPKGKEAGIISEPELTHIDLQPHDKFIIIGSDGIWDVMNSNEAVSFVLSYLSAGRPKSGASTALVEEARNRWTKSEIYQQNQYCDDITAVVGFLNYTPPESTYGTMIGVNTHPNVYMP